MYSGSIYEATSVAKLESDLLPTNLSYAFVAASPVKSNSGFSSRTYSSTSCFVVICESCTRLAKSSWLSVLSPSSASLGISVRTGGGSLEVTLLAPESSFTVGPVKLPIPKSDNTLGGDVAIKTDASVPRFPTLTISLPTRIPPVVPPPAIAPKKAAAAILPDTSLVGSMRAKRPSMNAPTPASSPASAVASAAILVA